jgi:hypothetical protein
VGGNTAAGIRGKAPDLLGPRRPEEPDVRSTSPVLWELGEGNLPWLPDVRPAWARNRRFKSSGDPDGGNPSPK